MDHMEYKHSMSALNDSDAVNEAYFQVQDHHRKILSKPISPEEFLRSTKTFSETVLDIQLERKSKHLTIPTVS